MLQQISVLSFCCWGPLFHDFSAVSSCSFSFVHCIVASKAHSEILCGIHTYCFEYTYIYHFSYVSTRQTENLFRINSKWDWFEAWYCSGTPVWFRESRKWKSNVQHITAIEHHRSERKIVCKSTSEIEWCSSIKCRDSWETEKIITGHNWATEAEVSWLLAELQKHWILHFQW